MWADSAHSLQLQINTSTQTRRSSPTPRSGFRCASGAVQLCKFAGDPSSQTSPTRRSNPIDSHHGKALKFAPAHLEQLRAVRQRWIKVVNEINKDQYSRRRVIFDILNEPDAAVSGAGGSIPHNLDSCKWSRRPRR